MLDWTVTYVATCDRCGKKKEWVGGPTPECEPIPSDWGFIHGGAIDLCPKCLKAESNSEGQKCPGCSQLLTNDSVICDNCAIYGSPH